MKLKGLLGFCNFLPYVTAVCSVLCSEPDSMICVLSGFICNDYVDMRLELQQSLLYVAKLQSDYSHRMSAYASHLRSIESSYESRYSFENTSITCPEPANCTLLCDMEIKRTLPLISCQGCNEKRDDIRKCNDECTPDSEPIVDFLRVFIASDIMFTLLDASALVDFE